MKELKNMSLEELKAQKTQWYSENHENGNINKLLSIGRTLGERLSSNYGPKYKLHEPKTQTEIYVDDYGGYMAVTVNGKVKVSTHNEKLYVPGEWEEIITMLYPMAEETNTLKINTKIQSERDSLLNELS